MSKSRIEEAYSPESFRQSGHRIVDMLADHLADSLAGQHGQALPWIEPEESVARWRALAETQPSVEELTSELLAHSVRISDPKFMGHQICTPAPTAILAGFVTDFLNNGSGVYEMGMAGTAMEKHVIRVLASQLGMGPNADGFMTSGGTLANLTALLAARSARGGGDDWQLGTQQQLAVLVSDQAHYCVDRAVRIMGWGSEGTILVPTDDHFAMRVELQPELLASAQQAGKRVVAVVGSACTTSTGSFDNLDAIGQFCREHGLWFHVDGAHGAAVAFSQTHRHLLAGAEQADSLVLDFHKMLMTPVINSAIVFRDTASSFAPFAVEADYLFAQAEHEENNWDEYNLARRTFECTKTMLSAKVFSILAVHGTELLAENIDRLHANARQLADMIQAAPDMELATVPDTNIVCFRILPSGLGQSAISDHNHSVRERLTKTGKYYIVETNLNGETWLRSTLANPITSTGDLEGLLAAIRATSAACLQLPRGKHYREHNSP